VCGLFRLEWHQLTHLLSVVAVVVAPMVAAEAVVVLINQSLVIPLLLVMQSTPVLALVESPAHGLVHIPEVRAEQAHCWKVQQQLRQQMAEVAAQAGRLALLAVPAALQQLGLQGVQAGLHQHLQERLVVLAKTVHRTISLAAKLATAVAVLVVPTAVQFPHRSQSATVLE